MMRRYNNKMAGKNPIEILSDESMEEETIDEDKLG